MGAPRTTIQSRYLTFKSLEQHQDQNQDQVDYETQAALEFLDRKQAEHIDWREFIDLAEAIQDLDRRQDDTQRTAKARIRTDIPVAILFTGDWHLGAATTDHAQWRADIEFVLDTEGLYMVDLGDDRQNARNFRNLSVVLSQVLSPKNQAALVKGVIDELTEKKKLLAKVAANHDVEWDERIFGEALQKYLLGKMAAPRFINRGLLELQVGEEKYTLLLFHKSRFRSFLRATHGAMREHQQSFPADIVAGGHDHRGGFEDFDHYPLARETGFQFGGSTFLIKVGTYQDSDYGWKYYHSGGRPVNHTVVLWPDQHKMERFRDPHQAVRFIETFRDESVNEHHSLQGSTVIDGAGGVG